MKLTKFHQAALGLALLTPGAQPAMAATNFSFNGTFTHDNGVQLFHFSIGSATTVTLQTFSFGGGTNAAGNPVAAGGFTPVFSLFDADGGAITNSLGADSSQCGAGAADSATGACWDTFIAAPLAKGGYILALTQFDNVALGNLADGFSYDGGPVDFTGGPFLENHIGPSSFQRDGHWAVDILSVDNAQVVPLPSALPLLLSGLSVFAPFVRRRPTPQS